MLENYRRILHIDMDAFFASVEQRDNPSLKGKPVVVGRSHGRGVVAAASYEARKFGIHSAMSSNKAKILCPDLIFVPLRFEQYKFVSSQIRDIFGRYTDIIEPLSLDEAFLDVTENKKGIVLGQDIAKEIKQTIKEELNLTASAGVSYNKFLAKIASDMQKPDGLTVIHPRNAIKIISKLPIEAFWGIGKVNAKKMHEIGIHTGEDLQNTDANIVLSHFGKLGALLVEFAKGNDPRCVEVSRERKSVGCERTFGEDIFERHLIFDKIYEIVEELEKRIARSSFNGHTLTLKIRRDDFRTITRSRSVDTSLRSKSDFLPIAIELLEGVDLERHGIRLLGLSVSNPIFESNLRDNQMLDSQLDIPFPEW